MKIRIATTFLLSSGSIFAPALIDNNLISLAILAICYGGLSAYLYASAPSPAGSAATGPNFRWTIGIVSAFIVYAIFQITVMTLYMTLSQFGLSALETSAQVSLAQGLLAAANVVTAFFCFFLGMLWLARSESLFKSALAFAITLLLIVTSVQSMSVIFDEENTLRRFENLDLATILSGGMITIALYTIASLLGAWLQIVIEWLRSRSA